MQNGSDNIWNERAANEKDEINVNIADIYQRELEYDYICRYLSKDMKVLEIGCGNGYSTARFRPLVTWIDAIDSAGKMIERARSYVGETNNRFILDDILSPHHIHELYDTVISVRILINLRNLQEQQRAVENMAHVIKPSGLLILFEGYRDGFAALTELREKVGLSRVVPSTINFYSSFDDIEPTILKYFIPKERFHLGSYDFLTRLVYPLVEGEENVRHNTDFSRKCMELARRYNPDEFESFSRMRGILLEKRREDS